MLICRLNSLLIDIQTGNLTFEFPGEIKSRSAGTTGYLQDLIASREIEPTVENIIFIGGDPTVLTNIVPIGFSSYCCQHLFFEVAIGAVVEINRIRHAYLLTLKHWYQSADYPY